MEASWAAFEGLNGLPRASLMRATGSLNARVTMWSDLRRSFEAIWGRHEAIWGPYWGIGELAKINESGLSGPSWGSFRGPFGPSCRLHGPS